MAAASHPYARLTRNASSIGTYASLWLGDDHLMIVTSTGYSESYARLQFRDIKGFFVTRSDRRFIWGVVWGVLTAICALVVIVQLVNRNAPVVSGIFLGLCAGVFAWNHLLGPGCMTYVVTGVQTAKLPSLVRLKQARRVLDRVRPLIEAAQADLVVAPAALPPLVAPPTAPPTGSPEVVPAQGPPGSAEPPPA